MNREVHVRIWERPEVRVLRATRHEERFLPRRLRVCSKVRRRCAPAGRKDFALAAQLRRLFEVVNDLTRRPPGQLPPSRP